MRLKTASTYKEDTYGKMQSHEEQIQLLLKNLKTFSSPFHGAAKNMATGPELLVSVVSWLLSSREKGGECLKEFTQKLLTSREKGLYEPIKRSGFQIIIEFKKNQEKYLF